MIRAGPCLLAAILTLAGAALAHSQIGPVADYIALIALAQFRTLETCDALPTLLDMFTPACAGHRGTQRPGHRLPESAL
jgi:hypothetical protein